MYSVAGIIHGKSSEDEFTIYRTFTSVDMMLRALDALVILGAFNISVVKK